MIRHHVGDDGALRVAQLHLGCPRETVLDRDGSGDRLRSAVGQQCHGEVGRVSWINSLPEEAAQDARAYARLPELARARHARAAPVPWADPIFLGSALLRVAWYCVAGATRRRSA